MKGKISSTDAVAIWERAIEFDGELSPTAARALRKVRFSPHDLEYMRELSAKARAGSLTPQENLAVQPPPPQVATALSMPGGCSGSADFGLLTGSVKELGPQLGVVAFLLL